MRKILSFLACVGVCISLCLTAFAAQPQQWDIKSQTAVLIDAKTSQVLFDKNKDARMYPASITKILTGALAMQNGNLSDTLTASYDAVHSLPRGTSHIALDAGEQITLEQALYGLAIESANDAANVIAEAIGGTREQFCFLMNDYAMQLGATNSHFTNPHGLPDDNHYTTAYDMALITAAAIKTPRFCDIFSTRRYDIPPTNKKPETRQFWNANGFLNNQVPYEGIVMSKTGWTEESGHTLVAAAQRNGVTLIAVVMNSPRKQDSYSDIVAMFDYGFGDFEKVTVGTQTLVENLPADCPSGEGSIIKVEKENALADEISVLLPIGADPSGIFVEYGQAKEQGRCADITATVLYTQGDTTFTLCTVNITAIIQEPVVETTLSQKLFAFAKKPTFFIFHAIMWLVFGFTVWFILRCMIIYECRRRRKKRRMMKKQGRYNRSRRPTKKQELSPAQIQQRQAQRLRRQIYKD
ncbi:MAG: D-alanyl-D-alanine carboxypeptidase family protein [Oscillospiraceae bacterium]